MFDKYEIVQEQDLILLPKNFTVEELDWVVLLTAGIINVRDEWLFQTMNFISMLKEIWNRGLNSNHHFELLK